MKQSLKMETFFIIIIVRMLCLMLLLLLPFCVLSVNNVGSVIAYIKTLVVDSFAGIEQSKREYSCEKNGWAINTIELRRCGDSGVGKNTRWIQVHLVLHTRNQQTQ